MPIVSRSLSVGIIILVNRYETVLARFTLFAWKPFPRIPRLCLYILDIILVTLKIAVLRIGRRRRWYHAGYDQ